MFAETLDGSKIQTMPEASVSLDIQRPWTKSLGKATFVPWIYILLSLRDMFIILLEISVLGRAKEQTTARISNFLIEHIYTCFRK